jgi:hypothetical protein
MRPVSPFTKVRQELELNAHFVRLNLWELYFGAAHVALARPGCTAGARSVSGWASIFLKEKFAMRSDLVFGALSHVSNRYQLCQLASKATRKLHKPNTRLQDTANDVLARFQTINPGSSSGSALRLDATADVPVETRRAA